MYWSHDDFIKLENALHSYGAFIQQSIGELRAITQASKEVLGDGELIDKLIQPTTDFLEESWSQNVITARKIAENITRYREENMYPPCPPPHYCEFDDEEE